MRAVAHINVATVSNIGSRKRVKPQLVVSQKLLISVGLLAVSLQSRSKKIPEFLHIWRFFTSPALIENLYGSGWSGGRLLCIFRPARCSGLRKCRIK